MKILVTGANGYIGKRLIPALVDTGHEVYALVRDPTRLYFPYNLKKKIKIFVGDLTEFDSIEQLPSDIEIAYFLVHSLQIPTKDFMQKEERMAKNFLQILKKTNARQIIYLSGLISKEKLSAHLTSRHNVEKILQSSDIALTTLRAGIVVGSGSASFEIMRDLVEKLPIMITPKWVLSKCQPIAIRDAIDYLVQVIDRKDCYNQSYDIGGPDILTYKQMLYKLAKIRNLHRKILNVPVLTPRLSSYWLFFVTSTNFTIAKWLVDSLKTDAICKEQKIQKIISKKCLPYEEAIKRAFSKIEENAVLSKWTDSFAFSQIPANLQEQMQVPTHGCYINKRVEKFNKQPEKLVETIWKIGGDRGWYALNFLWRLRGKIDKLFGGVGLRRGRRDPGELHPGDALDFWRVLLADKEQRRLLLFAEMKLPGEAWLEFKIVSHLDHFALHQTATFRAKGILGRLYWYILFPFHHFVFDRMCKAIIKEANKS